MNQDERDRLVSRVVDAEATPEDWSALRELAEHDRAVWAELSAAQRDHAALSAAVESSIEPADRVELPADPGPMVVVNRRLRLAGAWGGWVAAAAALLAWSFGVPIVADSQAHNAGLGVSLPRPDSPAVALQSYFEQTGEGAKVVRELPEKVIVSIEPADASRVRVLYLRRFLEWREEPGLFRPSGEDESGLPAFEILDASNFVAPSATGGGL